MLRNPKARVVFNSGLGGVLCSGCDAMIRAGSQLSLNDIKFMKGEIKLPPQYCDECKKKLK